MLHEEFEPDGLRRVILDAGRGNALGSELLAAVTAAFDPARIEVGPVVLTGRGRSFCTGLDLAEAADLDRAQMQELIDGFHRALQAVLVWPAPVIALLQGHALAGGALLALCADRRILVHGPARFGVHGVHLGVVYPQVAVEVARWRLGRARAEDLLYGGALRSGLRALREGLVDELVEAGESLERAQELARRPAAAKLELVRPVAEDLARIDPVARENWLDHWFDPATRERVLSARDALLGRRGPRPGEGQQ